MPISSVFRNEKDRMFLMELTKSKPDKNILLPLYSESSKGFRSDWFMSWFPTMEGPCHAIAICSQPAGEQHYERFSAIAAFATMQERDFVLKLHNDFETWFWSNEINERFEQKQLA